MIWKQILLWKVLKHSLFANDRSYFHFPPITYWKKQQVYDIAFFLVVALFWRAYAFLIIGRKCPHVDVFASEYFPKRRFLNSKYA